MDVIVGQHENWNLENVEVPPARSRITLRIRIDGSK